jgi:hypothetical protein
MEAILIPADGSEELRFVEVDGLDSLQSFVGGCIEAVPTKRDDVTAYVNEEGLIHGLPVNERAERLLVYGNGYLGLRGDCLLLGPVDRNGEDTPVTSTVLHDLGIKQAGL